MKKVGRVILIVLICCIGGTKSTPDLNACPLKCKAVNNVNTNLSTSGADVFVESFNTWVEATRFKF